MVGFKLTTSNWNNNIIEVCKNFYLSKAVLYSFELKKSISMDTLREYYFQAVSNSSWSNEGYLVTASLDENHIELISEIKRLVGAFGIGIIKLDILNSNNSSILFPAKRRDILDGETMNKLYIINPDYRDFIQDVTNSLQINKLVVSEWDTIEEAKKYVEDCKNKAYYKIEEEYLDCGMCSIIFSTIELLKKPKDRHLNYSKSDSYEYFFDSKEDFMEHIETKLEIWDEEDFLIINKTDLDIDLDLDI